MPFRKATAKEIRGLLDRMPPGHRRIRVDAAAWACEFRDFPIIRINFDQLAQGIQRDEAIEVVSRAVAAERLVEGFVIAMMWGHGPNGYGPYRTRRILEQAPPGRGTGAAAPSVLRSLEGGLHLLGLTNSEIDAHGAFWYFNNSPQGDVPGGSRGHVKHFGPAFFTKWMSMVSANGNPHAANALPIVDAVTARWWRAHVNPSFKLGRTADYVGYVEKLAEWRDALADDYEDVTLMRIEEAIFENVRGLASLAPRAIDIEGVLK